MNNQKHEFALYVSNLSQRVKSAGDVITLDDAQVVHRLSTVLRVKAGEQIRLFDNDWNALCTIRELIKKKITGVVETVHKNQTFKPFITAVLPLLKKDSLAEAIYSCVELGVQEVYLISTAKTQRSSLAPKELEHLKKIAISAAEQSKNFALPIMHVPRPLTHYLQESHAADAKIFFDPSGKQAKEIIGSIHTASRLVIIIGPEGDLTAEEKTLLNKHQFLMCALTATILRAQEALVVGAGLIRSMCKN